MIKRINNRKIKALLVLLMAILLFFLIWRVAVPAYDRYVENDHAVTCVRVRFVIIDNYDQAVEDQRAEGKQAEEIDYELILDNVLQDIQETFPETQIEKMTGAAGNWSVSRLCRSGGVYTITIDPDSHRLNTVCDLHGEYNLGFSW